MKFRKLSRARFEHNSFVIPGDPHNIPSDFIITFSFLKRLASGLLLIDRDLWEFDSQLERELDKDFRSGTGGTPVKDTKEMIKDVI